MDFFKHFEIQWKAVDSVAKMRYFLPLLVVKGRKFREAADYCSTRRNQVVNKLKERKQMSPTQRTSGLFKRSSKNFLELMLKLLLWCIYLMYLNLKISWLIKHLLISKIKPTITMIITIFQFQHSALTDHILRFDL